MKILQILCAGLGLMVSAAGAGAQPATPAAQTAAARPEQHTVVVDGHPLTVWSKRPESPRGAILLVHGRTWSSLPNWDLRVPGEDRSVMDALARAGYAAYALDQRGYGATPRDSSGVLTPSRAVADAAGVLEWIAGREGGARPAILGYSLGASVALLTAARHPDKLSAAILYAFAMDVDAPFSSTPAGPPARQATTAEGAASDFITPGAQPQAVVDAYVRQALASDPVRMDWQGQAEFAVDPAEVRIPVLLLHGVGDPIATTDKQAKLFVRLGTEDRAWIILPDADHAAHVENAQARWVHAVTSFLDRPGGR
jgi:alpha-beta hydrolase superfamily lysophospholipase